MQEQAYAVGTNWRKRSEAFPVESAATVRAPFGTITVIVRQGCVAGIDWAAASGSQRSVAGTSELACEAARQLGRYLTDPSSEFDLPLAPPRTPFQARLRDLLCAIPPGATCTYGSIAAVLGVSPRGVGAGCRANPLPFVVPCHRVVAQKGMGGYSGAGRTGVDVKRWLLAHEGAV